MIDSVIVVVKMNLLDDEEEGEGKKEKIRVDGIINYYMHTVCVQSKLTTPN